MKFKKGDIVFFKNRSPIGWERGFTLATLIPNRLYSISNVGAVHPDREFVEVFDTVTPFHIDHFQLAEGDEIQGIPIYKAGEMIECVNTKPVDNWEANSPSVNRALALLKVGERYRVNEFMFSNGMAYIRVDNGGLSSNTWIKPSHFKR